MCAEFDHCAASRDAIGDEAIVKYDEEQSLSFGANDQRYPQRTIR